MAIELEKVSKAYYPSSSPLSRVMDAIMGRTADMSLVLKPFSLNIQHGEIVGLIGVNGAGKSTLLKLIAQTTLPTTGVVSVKGSVCALLELGAGFHPDMTGRENIFLGGAVAGMSTAEIQDRFDEIVQFAGLDAVIDRPVKTYSSGMMMRLAFSLATSVDPDILILDETLSVGDGHFAKKSFDRIMGFKEAGKTILFCSHSMYQVQAICSRVIWMDEGVVRMDGSPPEVIAAYTDFMTLLGAAERPLEGAQNDIPSGSHEPGTPRILKVEASSDGVIGHQLPVRSGTSDVTIRLAFEAHSSEAAPLPVVGVVLVGANGQAVTSASTRHDGYDFSLNANGRYHTMITFPHLDLLAGSYWVHVYLLCDQGLHIYDKARMVAELVVTQDSLEQGIVRLPHEWAPVSPDIFNLAG